MLDSEEEPLTISSENQRLQSSWPSHSNTVPYTSGGGDDTYGRGNERDFCSSKPAKVRVLAMERHLSLQWDEGPPELVDKRVAQLSASRRKFCSTVQTMRNLESLHRSLGGYQRKLPLGPWCQPVGSGRSRHQLPCSPSQHTALDVRRTSSTVTHPKRPHQEDDDTGGDFSLISEDHI